MPLAGALLLLCAAGLHTQADVVNEKLSVQPLNSQDLLLVLDLEVNTENHVHFQEQMAYPGVLMDTLAPDFSKLYLRSQCLSFEAIQHAGEWKETWGKADFPIFKNGVTLQASWSDVHSDVEVYNYFETLAHDLWGVTGSQFHFLTSKDVVMFDLTRIASLEDPINLGRKAKNLMASFSEDIFCVDNIYKWRTVLPSMANDGLISIINDERIWSRAPYKGVKTKMAYKNSVLSLLVQFQVVVTGETIGNSLWNIYPRKTIPSKLLGVTSSAVEFFIPAPFRSKYERKNTVKFDFLADDQKAEIDTFFAGLRMVTAKGFKGTLKPGLTFKVSELDSMTHNVSMRMQSSLSIVVKNNENVEKYVKFVQPLPYWALPQLSSMTIRIVQNEGTQNPEELYSCEADKCLYRTSYRESHMGHFLAMDTKTMTFHNIKDVTPGEVDTVMQLSRYADTSIETFDTELEENLSLPLVLFEKSHLWIQYGFSLKLPPNSAVFCRVELQKNKFTHSEINFIRFRGQLIHSGIIIESQKATFDDFAELDAAIHLTGELFISVLLVDTTMVFNVMAFIGIISGLLFGLVFNISTKKFSFGEIRKKENVKQD